MSLSVEGHGGENSAKAMEYQQFEEILCLKSQVSLHPCQVFGDLYFHVYFQLMNKNLFLSSEKVIIHLVPYNLLRGEGK